MFLLGVQVAVYGQSEVSECDEYRQIIEKNIKDLELSDVARSMIVGKNNEYINPGLSKRFISEPQIPEYIYTIENLNMKIVDIIVAHVNLYHCDVEELKGLKKRNINTPAIESDNLYKVFPNPTQGHVNIEGKIEKIKQILLFDGIGKLIKRISNIESSFDISELNNGTYHLYFLSQEKIQSQKIIKI